MTHFLSTQQQLQSKGDLSVQLHIYSCHKVGYLKRIFGHTTLTLNSIRMEQMEQIIFLLIFLGFLLILIITVYCNWKQREQRRNAANHTACGDNIDPDARVEVEDSNAYYSTDYEAGPGTSRTDYNPYYEWKKLFSMQYEIEKYIFGKEKCCFHEIALTKLIFVSIDGLFRFEKWAQSDVQLSTACCEQ